MACAPFGASFAVVIMRNRHAADRAAGGAPKGTSHELRRPQDAEISSAGGKFFAVRLWSTTG